MADCQVMPSEILNMLWRLKSLLGNIPYLSALLSFWRSNQHNMTPPGVDN